MGRFADRLWNFLLNTMEFLLKKVFKLKLTGKQWDNLVQFVKFGLVGVSNTVIAYVVYLLVLQTGAYYVVANLTGFFVSVINAFYWNNRFVFQPEEGKKRSVPLAFCKTLISYSGTGVVLSNALLLLWVELVQIPEEIAPVINLLITIPLNFILNKFWAFKGKNEK